MARWGWNIMEIEGDAAPSSESEDIADPSSPTGSMRLALLIDIYNRCGGRQAAMNA